MNCGGIREIYRSRPVEHIAPETDIGMSPAKPTPRNSNEGSEMISKKARVTFQAAGIAAAMLCSPIAMHAQNADSTQTYATTNTTDGGRHFDWGWLGLLGLLGLLPKKRKETVVETRTTGTTGTGAGGRY
jgi:hypothetical protein